ncbi:MAG: metallophosphoesterase [Nevskiaceae bacterium]|jgi:serine/threonine protein phosphatase 1|nr:metallophosphoesterase [Nevskiaceae bacterium]
MLKTFALNTTGRDFAVGDIHGHFSLLAAGLRAIKFDESRDRLFSVGDLVDRGPESAQVTDWLVKPWFHAVRGNHEVMACGAIGQHKNFTLMHLNNGGRWIYALTPAERERVSAALLELPLAIEVQTEQGPVGVVHADLPTDDWQDMRNGELSSEDAAHCVWSTARYDNGYLGKVRNARAVVHGHMTVARMQTMGNAHFIDTGAGMEDGYFTFLNLATLKTQRWPRKQ